MAEEKRPMSDPLNDVSLLSPEVRIVTTGKRLKKTIRAIETLIDLMYKYVEEIKDAKDEIARNQ